MIPSNDAAQKQMTSAIRALAMDAVQKAKSGHPGAPLGMADMALALWGGHLNHNPANPAWANRDRFVLSNGHASMLIYALLHLTGYDLSIDELKNFRQLHSKTAGHPEVGITPGVETTTGPLGQGIANAVGMALAEKILAAEFNRAGHEIVNHHTYAFLGDGCLMEGISHEVCSLAGAWQLGKLIALYDDNGISIDGKVAPWFIDNTKARFESYGWNVLGTVDGHDANAVAAEIQKAKSSTNSKPTLIICKTSIGKGSPNRAGTAKAHGEPFGEEEIALTRKEIGWEHAPFVIPDEIYKSWSAKDAGAKLEEKWNAEFAAYKAAHPELAAEFLRRTAGDLPAEFTQILAGAIKQAEDKKETVASRKASQIALEIFTQNLPEMLGGSADLTGSNLTQTKSTPALRFAGANVEKIDGKIGRHINYGVREFGMAAIMNGVALHGGYIPYGGTFLTFSDYSRNAIRMAALMKQRVIHVFTHDSIGLGEDGPTHQSIEHAASLRLIPNLDVWRPADVSETTAAWGVALSEKTRPSAMLLSRQNLPHLDKSQSAGEIEKGAYVLKEEKNAQITLIATGSEVGLAIKAAEQLAGQNIKARVVSMPSASVYMRQTAEYKKTILPREIPSVAIEMGSTALWWQFGVSAVVGIDTYGESAPAPVLFEHFGFTAENVCKTVINVLNKNN